MLQTERVVLFYGHKDPFSNMHPSEIEVNGLRFGSVEQGYMVCKAGAFDDKEVLARLLEEKDPYECKKLGRMVSGFDSKRWDESKAGVMLALCVAKFIQNEKLGQELIATGDKRLGEASPTDMVWGIGLAKDSPLALEPRNWKGRNLLGEILMDVRRRIVEGAMDHSKYFPGVDPTILKDAGFLQG
jgi:ribA/ribD-fused uncharacterized protein